ncbi:MAG: shikimate dehydrogenase [Peptococcaceae bacterium]|nr:MAG: shikimate dehydrogenase [Peptococcaceae bacterium]
MQVDGHTRTCGIFGYPVRHTFSPAMHNAAFAALGLNFVYVPFLVPAEYLPAAVAAIRALGLIGVNITIPHKEAVLPYLDQLSREARMIGAVNTIINQGGRLVGHNTDGRGLLRSLAEEACFNPAGKSALVLGAGGAARSVAVALVLAGTERIFLANRSPRRAEALAGLLARIASTGITVVPRLEKEETALAKAVARADLIVQTTPVGMHPAVEECVSFPFSLLRPGQLVCDLIYNPLETKFLELARLAGAKTVNGMGMMIYQGALAFTHWTGQPAPVAVMREALQRAAGLSPAP